MRSAVGMDLSLALTQPQPHLEDGVTYRPLRPTRRGIQVSRASTLAQLRHGGNLMSIVSEDEEDLYSVLRARSELMG